MQKINVKKYARIWALLITASLALPSCLKENLYPPIYGRSVPNIISFQDNGGSDGSGAGYGSTTIPFPLYTFTLNTINDTAGFDAIVIYGPNSPAPEDITLQLAINQTALDSFNNANQTDYVLPDPSIYSVPTSVTIPKGQFQGYAHIVITQSPAYNSNLNYAIPLTITSASYGTVSANFGTEINGFTISN